MTAFPPLDLRLSGARLSCIIDVRLALSGHGLMLAWRLAEEMDVWLYRGFFALLDAAEIYRAEPEALVGGPARGIGPPLNLAVAREALAQWEPARLEDNVPSFPFFYLGDLRYESHLPAGTDAELIRRFDVLAKALHARIPLAGHEHDLMPQIECWRDATAVHAALAHRRPLLLTVAEAPDQAPALCQFLARCGLDCRRLDARASAPMQRYLTPGLLRTGVAELVWAGLPLAAVHIIAPGAFTIPRPKDTDDDALPPRAPVRLDGRDPWRHAICLWYPLS